MAFVSGASWWGEEKGGYQQLWRGCRGESGVWNPPPPNQPSGKSSLAGSLKRSRAEARWGAAVSHRVVSSLRGDGLEMGASPIAHPLTSENTPGPVSRMPPPSSCSSHPSAQGRPTPGCADAEVPPSTQTHPVQPPYIVCNERTRWLQP